LLVEDDIDDQLFYVEAVKEIDDRLEYTVASNGQEAIDTLNKLRIHPDLIFLDINMPGMNGIEFLIYLKKEARFNKIPIVILTTSASQTEQLYQHGARLIIIKPSKASMLRTALEHILNTDFSKSKSSHSLNGIF
jgi:CheY-like chemotaxis protein